MQHSDIQTVRATVRGRVQGVGFRQFVRECAKRHRLGGYVRNQQDGSVYVQASGPRHALDQLISDLRRGPSMSRVDTVDVDWAQENASSIVIGFEVRA